jgi:hypothetical protein
MEKRMKQVFLLKFIEQTIKKEKEILHVIDIQTFSLDEFWYCMHVLYQRFIKECGCGTY